MGILCFQAWVPRTGYWWTWNLKRSFQRTGHCRLPELRDVAELWRFLGMVNKLMKFCSNLAEHTKPLRDLLRTKTAWLWGPQQVDAFTYLKKELASESVFWIYHPEYETIVSADASSYGLGAVLLQKQPTGELKPVAYSSRSMMDTECRYAQIEKEA